WLPRRLLHPQLPFVLKLIPPKHVSKKVLIELCLFAQNPDTLAILAASCLQTNGQQMFASQHASRNIFIHDLLRVVESCLEHTIIGGEKLHRHELDHDAFVLSIGTAA